jgi:hypothetical protein
MNINLGFLQFASWKRDNPDFYTGSGFWFRFFGYGLHFTNGRMSFSERNGYVKIRRLPFGWRFKPLKKGKY